jgi:phage FluMu gp28-like protein
MTREFIDACAMWAKAFNIAAGDVGEFLFDDIDEHGKSRSIQAFRIQFASGFEIIALSGKPRNLRGKQGLAIIDEAAFVDSLAELIKAAMAFTIWGGKVVVISTHDGADNPFNQLVDDVRAKRRGGEVIRITFDDAIADGLYERICLVKGETPTPEGKLAFIAKTRADYGDDADEELDCIPRTGSGSLIPPELVVAAQHADAGKPDLYAKGLCVIGRDVARRRDLSVIWCFELVGNVLWLRERHEEAGITFADQDAIFDKMFADYRILRAAIDQTGMGEKVVEDAKARHGDRVEGVLFTGPNKLDMATALLKRFQDGTIRIPDDANIRADFRAIKRAKAKGDAVRLVNEGTLHADMFWAAALAALMAQTEPLAYAGYQGIPRATSPFPSASRDDDETRRFKMRPDERAPSRGRFGKGSW